MFDDRSDEQLSMEDPGVRCMVWGYRMHRDFIDAVLGRVLAELTKRQADKVLRIYADQHELVKQETFNKPLKRPTWAFGDYEGLDEDD